MLCSSNWLWNADRSAEKRHEQQQPPHPPRALPHEAEEPARWRWWQRVRVWLDERLEAAEDQPEIPSPAERKLGGHPKVGRERAIA